MTGDRPFTREPGGDADRKSHSHVVLFDLDGTLVDSFPGISDAYHHVRAELGLPPVDDAQMRPLIGPPIQVGLERHFGLTGTRLEEGVRIFRAHYADSGWFRFSKYPGVDPMLLELHARGLRLGIATSKLRAMAAAIIERAGWSDLFELVEGAESDGSRYLKRDVIECAISCLPPTSHVVAMVGDRAEDMVASRELGLRAIGVTWGYGSALELRRSDASLTVDSPDQLLEELTRFL